MNWYVLAKLAISNMIKCYTNLDFVKRKNYINSAFMTIIKEDTDKVCCDVVF